jgi:hypothetical protein
MTKLVEGTQIEFHTKVNIDPLGSHCSLCGKRTTSKLWFPLGYDGKINATEADPNNPFSEAIWGWWPVGSECAKKFERGIVIERN